MKKIIYAALFLFTVSASLFAKDSGIVGEWLLTAAKMGDKVEEPNQLMNFKNDGYAEIQGRVFGKWKYDAAAKTLTIESEMIKEFAGAWKVSTDKDKMTFKSDKTELDFVKYDAEKIKKENSKSGLIGVWKLNEKGEDGGDVYINFKESEISIMEIAPGVTGKNGGLWIFDPQAKNVVLITPNRMLRGSNKIINISPKSFEFENRGNKITAVKIEQNAKNREILTLEENGGGDENPVTLDPGTFSWFDYDAKINYLKNIKKLKYIKSTLLADFDAFASEEIAADVSFDENNYVVTIGPLFEKLSTNDNDRENVFYPIEELDFYNVIGQKTITVPAGTFSCTVVEAENDFGTGKNRFYMINDRPGIYAKIIVFEKDFSNEKYTMYELSEIVGDPKTAKK